MLTAAPADLLKNRRKHKEPAVKVEQKTINNDAPYQLFKQEAPVKEEEPAAIGCFFNNESAGQNNRYQGRNHIKLTTLGSVDNANDSSSMKHPKTTVNIKKPMLTRATSTLEKYP